MKKTFTILFLLFSLLIKAQLYSGGSGPIQDDGNDTFFPINVTGLIPASIDSVFGLEQVCITINHSVLSELYIFLQSPSGKIVELTIGSGSGGTDFLNTCFDNQAGTSITLGTPPYAGNFRPVGNLGRFNTGVAGNGEWKLIVHDGYPGINSGNLISWNLKFGNIPAQPVAFKSSNLPIVVINSNQPITDLKTIVSMGIIDNGANRNFLTDPFNGYNSKAEIHLRGSSSKNFEKKSYSFETKDALGNDLIGPLLGMPSEIDWVLSALYVDKTLLRNPLALDLSRAMGNYSSRYKNVEVFLNNEYQGVYALTEKPKRDSNRVNIKKLEPDDNAFPDITGGYIIKIDRTDEPGWYSQFQGNCIVNTKCYYQYVYPNDLEITGLQQNYIQAHMNSFETAMNSPTFADPSTGYQKYIDVASFVDFFIINELSKNVDAYRLSTYLYKQNINQGGKIHIGPVWDYDIGWHNCNYGNSFDAAGWGYHLQDNAYPSPTWWIRLISDPYFLSRVDCRWKELRQNVLSNNYLNNYIDGNAATLEESQKRNFKQWPVLGAFIFPNPQSQVNATYGGEVSDLKTWLANRVIWLDANISGTCVVGFNEKELVNNLLVYPNPIQSSTTFSMQLEKDADVSLCITDIVGKEVARYLNTRVQPGDSKIVFERNQIKAGVYFYQLQIDNTIKTGKIIIQ